MTQPFAAPYAPPDEELVPALVAQVARDVEAEARIDATARALIEGIRERAGAIGGLEDFLRDYGLSTREGLALMAMAEALLRVPDAATQDALIADKIGQGDWEHAPEAETWFVSAAVWGLGLSNRMVRPHETPAGIVSALAKRLGAPAVRQGVRQAMRYLGHQFVLGETIEDALERARPAEAKGARHSYDMLGEGARTWDDARRYARSYAEAIEAIGSHALKGRAGNRPLPDRPGISVKLSALHPRYEARNREAVMRELVPALAELARAARSHDLNLTVDAEEQDRLELSLDVIAAAYADPSLRGWNGFGLAVQSYGKRALAVVDWAADLARTHGDAMMVRLVKGAYWDAEVKHAQVEGADDFPVWTRKPVTDVAFLACAGRMLEHRPHLYPQIATHNALTVATVMEMADATGEGRAREASRAGYEFQRLHGMGEELYEQVTRLGGPDGHGAVACRVYAPVGGHRDLLAYLVRRLLENGANSSFVARVGDRKVRISELLERPAKLLEGAEPRHARIPRAGSLFGSRRNSLGVEFGSREQLDALVAAMRAAPVPEPVEPATIAEANAAMERAHAAFPAWRDTPVDTRAAALERAADLLETHRPRLLAILAREAGKTIDDGVAELREAIDFLRFYASEARRLMAPTPLPGPAGEENVHTLRGRGVALTIAPWNFPLAIFLGQTAAALATGNAVVAKPAPQTPVIGREAVALLHGAGVPEGALQFVPGGTEVGRALVDHPAVALVAFTGSTATALAINRALAARDGPIVALVAETGGINAMVVDATALPEQVADDVLTSAFRSAGQRCSAARILHVQDDVAGRMLAMIEGAAATLRLGDPMDPATDIGPIIDADALARLEAHVARHEVRWQCDAPPANEGGHFMPPTIIELKRHETLDEEVFGPVLHVKRFAAGRLDAVIDEVNASGYGLTFGLHSRIQATVARVVARVEAGNVYVNRNQIGAVVGSQPFGGRGRSGTGPKAGGPLYLARFAEERVVTTDTTAAGGNASLIAMGDG